MIYLFGYLLFVIFYIYGAYLRTRIEVDFYYAKYQNARRFKRGIINLQYGK
jgi:hypothetical protein